MNVLSSISACSCNYCVPSVLFYVKLWRYRTFLFNSGKQLQPRYAFEVFFFFGSADVFHAQMRQINRTVSSTGRQSWRKSEIVFSLSVSLLALYMELLFPPGVPKL